MSKSEDEQYLDYLRYQEVPRETISKKDTRWLSGRGAKRVLKAAQRDAKKSDKNGRTDG